MVRAVRIAGFWAPWAVAAVAALIAVHFLLAQAALQGDLIRAMQGVLTNVRETVKLTGETARALAPLKGAADTLERMNGRLRTTAADLTEMNGALGRVSARQQEMLSRLESLAARTRTVVTALGDVDGKNKALLEATTGLAAQTGRQAMHLEDLAGLTDESVAYLQTLNRRLLFLRRI